MPGPFSILEALETSKTVKRGASLVTVTWAPKLGLEESVRLMVLEAVAWGKGPKLTGFAEEYRPLAGVWSLVHPLLNGRFAGVMTKSVE